MHHVRTYSDADGATVILSATAAVVKGIRALSLTIQGARFIHEGGYDLPDHQVRIPIMASPSSHITSVLKETRSFPPPKEFAAQAHIKSLAEYEKLYQTAKDNPEGFWAQQAESLQWIKRWDKVLIWNEPHAQWFAGGMLNVSANCLDRHLSSPRRSLSSKHPRRCFPPSNWIIWSPPSLFIPTPC